MKIRSFRTLVNRVFTVAMRTEDWGQDDIRRLHQYGDPEINIGGDITVSPAEGDDQTITLADEYVRIYSDSLRLTMSFDARDYASSEEAKLCALAWEQTLLTRIEDAVTALRANTLDFNAESVTNLNGDEFNAERIAQI